MGYSPRGHNESDTTEGLSTEHYVKLLDYIKRDIMLFLSHTVFLLLLYFNHKSGFSVLKSNVFKIPFLL